MQPPIIKLWPLCFTFGTNAEILFVYKHAGLCVAKKLLISAFSPKLWLLLNFTHLLKADVDVDEKVLVKEL